MLKHFQTGPLPLWHGGPAFNHKKWLTGRHIEVSNRLPATHKDYRMRKARQLLARLDAGALVPGAAAGVERDYSVELARLRRGRKAQTASATSS